MNGYQNRNPQHGPLPCMRYSAPGPVRSARCCGYSSKKPTYSTPHRIRRRTRARTLKKLDVGNESIEQYHLWSMLVEFDVPRDIISDVSAAGYNTAIRLLRMPRDVGEAFFGELYSKIWNACVAYVQTFSMKLDDMYAALEAPRKFEIMMEGSKWLEFLRGGFRSHEFVLVSGESGLGKTLLMLTLSLRAAMVGVTVYFLESDDKVDVGRVHELCWNLKINKETLQSIKRISIFSHGEQLAAIRYVQQYISNSPIGSLHLVIVDSLTGTLRRELPGIANIDNRLAIIAKCIDAMKKMASDDAREVIVAATTDVATACRSSNSNVDGMTSLGGCILQHNATTRIFLSCDRQNGDNVKFMTLQTSLHAPPSRTRYKICKEGIVLLDDLNKEDQIDEKKETQRITPRGPEIHLTAGFIL